MDEKPVINIMGTQPHPEDDEKFNQWYNETHIPLILKFKGIKGATRYRRVGDNEDYPKYLAIDKFESIEALQAYTSSPEFAAAMAEKNETWKDRDFEIKWRVQYEPIESWGE